MIRKKINKGIIAMLLAISLTGCGAKQTETVEEYGGTVQSVTVGESEVETGSSEVSAEGSADPGSYLEGSLSDKLGGEEANLKGDFTIGDISVNIDAHVSVRDTEQLPSYKIRKIEESDFKEEETVSSLLGAGAEKADRVLSVDNGDSSELIDSMIGLYLTYNEEAAEAAESKTRDEEVSNSNMPGWVDDENYYIHTYEGDVNGVTYQLSLGFDKRDNTAFIGYFPKKVGDFLGNSNIDTVMNFWIPEDLRNQATVQDFLATDKLKGSGESELKDAESFLREKAGIKIPENYMQFGVTGSEEDKEQLFYVSGAALQKTVYENSWSMENIFDIKKCFDEIGPDNSEINGFIADLGRYISNQEVYLPFGDSEDSLYSDGQVYLTDKGIMGFRYTYNYEFEEKVSDNVPVLSFDSLVPALENELADSMDPTVFSGKTINISDAYLVYYPMPSPSDQKECTFVPAWEFLANEYSTAIVMNAMDGSIISVSQINY